MDGSIQLTAEERKRSLRVYRSGGDARVARRAHILLLLDDGRSYREIMRITYASSETIAGLKGRYRSGGLEVALADTEEEGAVPLWQVLVAGWLVQKTPQGFGFFRRRWSCEMLALLLAEEHGIEVSPETIRRGLHALGFAWRRPRPVVGPTDPHYEDKLRRIRALLRHLPRQETAVFQDEVDVHLNPKIGPCWMLQGQQLEVKTPGNNQKRHLAGSLVWRTGTLLLSPPQSRRNAKLFVAHLEDLRRRLRGYRKIHVICDNAKFHDCRLVQEYLAQWGHRIDLHFLPKYAPEANPIERVWWHLHEMITRNHRCATIDELLGEVFDYFHANGNYFCEMRSTFAAAA